MCISNVHVCDGIFHCKQNLTDEDFGLCERWKCAEGFVKLSGKYDDDHNDFELHLHKICLMGK